MAGAELKVHVDCPDGIVISVRRDGDSWEFFAGEGRRWLSWQGILFAVLQ